MRILFSDPRPFVVGSACNYYSEIVCALRTQHNVTHVSTRVTRLSQLGSDYDLLLLGFAYTNVGGKHPAPLINDIKKPVGIILNKEYDALDKKLAWIKAWKPTFILTVHHLTEGMRSITGIPTHRIMWSADTAVFKDRGSPYLYDFSITGVVRNEQTGNWRRRILNTLGTLEDKGCRVYQGTRLQENNYQGAILSASDYAAVLSASKIFLATTSPADLISTRYFEAMATNRTLIITNRMSKQVFEDFLIEGFNCIMFDTLDEFYSKVSYYLAHEKERAEIVNRAYNYFNARLTWGAQAKNISAILCEYVPARGNQGLRGGV